MVILIVKQMKMTVRNEITLNEEETKKEIF